MIGLEDMTLVKDGENDLDVIKNRKDELILRSKRYQNLKKEDELDLEEYVKNREEKEMKQENNENIENIKNVPVIFEHNTISIRFHHNKNVDFTELLKKIKDTFKDDFMYTKRSAILIFNEDYLELERYSDILSFITDNGFLTEEEIEQHSKTAILIEFPLDESIQSIIPIDELLIDQINELSEKLQISRKNFFDNDQVLRKIMKKYFIPLDEVKDIYQNLKNEENEEIIE